MNSRLVLLLFVGVIASINAYRIPDTKKSTIDLEPRLLNFINDFYAQVVYPPLNHVVTSLSLLGAQVLAGLSQTGIPAPNGRTIHPTEAQLRGFFDELWNNAVRPPLENALSGLSLMAAQLFAGIGTTGVNLGKRDMTEAEMRDFLDTLSQSLNNVFTNVVQKPLEDALSNGALMLAQVLAGAGVNGINLSNLFGKRDMTEAEMRDFFDTLSQSLNNVFTNVVQKPLEDALSNGALMLAQVLAGAGVNGINLSNLFGKRQTSELSAREEELRGIFDSMGTNILNGLQSVWTNIFQGPIEQAVQSSALMAAQVLAGIGTNGVNLGKRELEGVARGEIIDSLVAHANGLFTTQVKPLIENALNNAALHLAGVLADFSQTGFGRR